jgi:DNA-directed RNA polymerase specialized sigma24 family protein
MTKPKQQPSASKTSPKKREVHFKSTYRRELLGPKGDMALELRRIAKSISAMAELGRFADTAASYQPDLFGEEESEHRENSSRQFKRFWSSLTNAQKEAMRMVYVNNPDRLTKAEVARKLGIRIESLQERIDYAIKKLKKFFPEFGD